MKQTIKTHGASKVYRRDTIANLAPTGSKSLQYWRKQARDIFARIPSIHTVECVVDGLKASSQYVGERGENFPGHGVIVIVASTGGKWGKPRREYHNQVDCV